MQQQSGTSSKHRQRVSRRAGWIAVVGALALLAAACATDDGAQDTADSALGEAQAAQSEANVALADAQAASAQADAALAAAEEAQAAANLAQATAEGNQEAVAEAEAALAEAQAAADEARSQAAAAQSEADSARAAAEEAQAEAQAAAEREAAAPAPAPEPPAPAPEPPPPAPAAPAVPEEVVLVLAGPVLAINPDGPGQNNLPSVGIFFATYDSLTNWEIPADRDALYASLEGGNAGQAQPELAESWEISDDGSVYTFHLRQGVMSDAGNEMTAADVHWSLEKAMAAGTTGAFWLLVAGLTSIDQVEIIDDYTIRISGLVGDKLLPSLGTGWLAIYDSAYLLENHATEEDPYANEWLNQNVAGFGPYRVLEFGPGGDEMVLEARENYWGPQPALQRVIQRSVPDANSRLQLLLAGDVAFAAELTTLGVEQAKATDGVAVTRIFTTTGAFLALTYDPPFNDPAVRAAIAQAIPYQDIIDVVFQGDAVLWDSILIPPVPGYTNEFFRGYDIEAAGAVLSGIDAPLTLAYADGLPLDEEIAILVQNSFREAGFDLNIEKQPRATFDGRKYGRTGELQFFVDVLDTPAYYDANYYGFIYAGPGGFLNWFGYNNDELNAALEAVINPATMAEAALTIQRIYAEDYPIHPIAWTGLDYAHADFLTLPRALTGNGLVRIQDFEAAGG